MYVIHRVTCEIGVKHGSTSINITASKDMKVKCVNNQGRRP